MAACLYHSINSRRDTSTSASCSQYVCPLQRLGWRTGVRQFCCKNTESSILYLNAYSVLVVLKLEHMWNHLNGWLKQTPGPHHQSFWFGRPVEETENLRSNKIPTGSDITGLGTTVWEPILYTLLPHHVLSIMCLVNHRHLDFKSIIIIGKFKLVLVCTYTNINVMYPSQHPKYKKSKQCRFETNYQKNRFKPHFLCIIMIKYSYPHRLQNWANFQHSDFVYQSKEIYRNNFYVVL